MPKYKDCFVLLLGCFWCVKHTGYSLCGGVCIETGYFLFKKQAFIGLFNVIFTQRL